MLDKGQDIKAYLYIDDSTLWLCKLVQIQAVGIIYMGTGIGLSDRDSIASVLLILEQPREVLFLNKIRHFSLKTVATETRLGNKFNAFTGSAFVFLKYGLKKYDNWLG